MSPVTLTDAETRALAALDEDEIVRTLVDLVRVPSVTGTDAESELQHLQNTDMAHRHGSLA